MLYGFTAHQLDTEKEDIWKQDGTPSNDSNVCEFLDAIFEM